jgi:hypothetical protein
LRIGATYNRDSVTVRMVVDIVPCISIPQEWHDNERPVIKNVGPEELCNVNEHDRASNEIFVLSYEEYVGVGESAMSLEVSQLTIFRMRGQGPTLISRRINWR